MTSPGGSRSGQSGLQEAVTAFSEEVFQAVQRLLQAQHELVRTLLGSSAQTGSESGEAASAGADEQKADEEGEPDEDTAPARAQQAVAAGDASGDDEESAELSAEDEGEELSAEDDEEGEDLSAEDEGEELSAEDEGEELSAEEEGEDLSVDERSDDGTGEEQDTAPEPEPVPAVRRARRPVRKPTATARPS